MDAGYNRISEEHIHTCEDIAMLCNLMRFLRTEMFNYEYLSLSLSLSLLLFYCFVLL